MTQVLEAVVKISIPEDFVLVTKVEYESLRASEMKSEIGDMKWFKQLVGLLNDSIIKERILYPHRKNWKSSLYTQMGQLIRSSIKMLLVIG